MVLPGGETGSESVEGDDAAETLSNSEGETVGSDGFGVDLLRSIYVLDGPAATGRTFRSVTFPANSSAP